MSYRSTFACFALALIALALAIGDTAMPPSLTAVLKPGRVELKSAGPMAFGPDGILFIGDSIGASIVEIDTNDRTAARAAGKVDIQGIDTKIAAMAGIAPDQIAIRDVKVNPISRNVYLSVARGRGPDGTPLIVRFDGSGSLTNLALDNVRHASVSLNDAPASNPGARQDPRLMTITDMAYVNGNLMVAGLSNEEWSSAFRSFPLPFSSAAQRSTIQIWHAAHGRYETQSPVRTFVPYTLGGQPHILAAYTCTPLVKIPVSSLKPGGKVKGVTIADLGSGNQPLDMVPYKKDGGEYILIANSSRGLMKVKGDGLDSYAAIDAVKVNGPAGVPYETLDVKNVQQLAAYDQGRALILTGPRGAGPLDLQTIALP